MRRIWSETVPYEVLTSNRTLGLLRRFGLELIVAVRPWDLPRVADVVAACAHAGVATTSWPMLADEDGRWANVENAARFARFVEEIEARVPSEHGPPSFAVDLEPAIRHVRALTAGRPSALAMVRPAREIQDGASELARLTRGLRGRGARVMVAALPVFLRDRGPAARLWQRLLGTPLGRLEYDAVHLMLYSTMLEGWSRGLLDRPRVRALLSKGCTRVPLGFGRRGGVALGAVGVGALGDEPTYRSPAELADDVAIATAAGVDDLSLFDLGGVLARPPIEAWLEAFCGQGG